MHDFALFNIEKHLPFLRPAEALKIHILTPIIQPLLKIIDGRNLHTESKEKQSKRRKKGAGFKKPLCP